LTENYAKVKEEQNKSAKDACVNSPYKPRVYKTRKFIRSNITTRSLVDTVSYVKDKKDGSVGDYVVVHHSHHADKAYKIQKKTVENKQTKEKT
jgi:hypothetical protein